MVTGTITEELILEPAQEARVDEIFERVINWISPESTPDVKRNVSIILADPDLSKEIKEAVVISSVTWGASITLINTLRSRGHTEAADMLRELVLDAFGDVARSFAEGITYLVLTQPEKPTIPVSAPGYVIKATISMIPDQLFYGSGWADGDWLSVAGNRVSPDLLSDVEVIFEPKS